MSGKKIYVGSRLENTAIIRAVCTLLEQQGHTITYNWASHGKVKGPGADPAPGRRSLRLNRRLLGELYT